MPKPDWGLGRLIMFFTQIKNFIKFSLKYYFCINFSPAREDGSSKIDKQWFERITGVKCKKFNTNESCEDDVWEGPRDDWWGNQLEWKCQNFPQNIEILQFYNFFNTISTIWGEKLCLH
jgi:hypothetical protein